jgi:hypothetical protein
LIIVDNFLSCYDELKSLSLKPDAFVDTVSPVDGVMYPLICAEIPETVKKQTLKRVCDILGSHEINFIFMRKSPLGVKAPHFAHNDLSMGDLTLIVYLNDSDECGTVTLAHKKTGISHNPELDDFQAIVWADCNNVDEWAITNRCTARQNRAVLMPAGEFHAALPVGGFGINHDARVVLVCFLKKV